MYWRLQRYVIIALIICLLALMTQASTRSRKRRQSSTRGSCSTRRKYATAKDHLIVDMYHLNGRNLYIQSECKLNKNDSGLKSFGDALKICQKDVLQKSKEWRFVEHNESEIIAIRDYKLDQCVDVLFDKMVAPNRSRIQLWQWKDVAVNIAFKRLNPELSTSPDSVVFSASSYHTLTSIWHRKYPNSWVRLTDLDVFVLHPSSNEAKQTLTIGKNERGWLFVLPLVHRMGDHFILLIEESLKECSIEISEMKMDQHLVKTMDCGHRFLMSAWCSWPGTGCAYCRHEEICDECGHLANMAPTQKYMCGHIVHTAHINNTPLACPVCTSFFFEVILPSGERTFYEQKERNRNIYPLTQIQRVVDVLKHFSVLDPTIKQPLAIFVITNDEQRKLVHTSDCLTQIFKYIRDPSMMVFQPGYGVLIRFVRGFGEEYDAADCFVNNDTITLRDCGVTGVGSDVRIVKMQRASLGEGRQIGLDAPLQAEFKGVVDPLVQIISKVIVPVEMDGRKFDCERYFHWDRKIKIAGVLQSCIRQVNSRLEENGQRYRLPKLQKFYDCNYRSIYGVVAERGDFTFVFPGGELLSLSFEPANENRPQKFIVEVIVVLQAIDPTTGKRRLGMCEIETITHLGGPLDEECLRTGRDLGNIRLGNCYLRSRKGYSTSLNNDLGSVLDKWENSSSRIYIVEAPPEDEPVDTFAEMAVDIGWP